MLPLPRYPGHSVAPALNAYKCSAPRGLILAGAEHFSWMRQVSNYRDAGGTVGLHKTICGPWLPSLQQRAQVKRAWDCNICGPISCDDHDSFLGTLPCAILQPGAGVGR